MSGPKQHNQQGFTIIELLIATTVFAVVLVVFLTAFLRVSELFYKGINMDDTQETARTVIQDITNDLQFSQQQPTVPANSNYFCVGIHRYTYYLDTQVANGGTSQGILRDVIGSGCPSPNATAISSNAEQLLDPGMQLNNLTLLSNGNSSWTISVHIVFYGDDKSVLVSPSGTYNPPYNDPNAQCSGGISSSQYCATADYQSTVLQNF